MKRKRRKAPNLEHLRSRLDYDSSTGTFKWRNGRCAGRVAGCLRPNGYISIMQHFAHVLAWFHFYGEWPANDVDIDHVNNIRSDNRINNLRLASRSENTRNRKKWTGKDLPLGVHCRYRPKNAAPIYEASICINGKGVRLGLFSSPEDAHKAYIAASKKYFGHFSPYKGR